MILGKVIGTVVASQKVEGIESLKLLLVANLDAELKVSATHVVAVDAVGAGVGEVIMYCTGSSARQTAATDNRPADAVIMAIVDQVEMNGEMKYNKGK